MRKHILNIKSVGQVNKEQIQLVQYIKKNLNLCQKQKSKMGQIIKWEKQLQNLLHKQLNLLLTRELI